MSDLPTPAVCGIFELRWGSSAMPQREANFAAPGWVTWGDQPNSRCTASALVVSGSRVAVAFGRGAFKARVQMLGPD
jgi:hypothetical protein